MYEGDVYSVSSAQSGDVGAECVGGDVVGADVYFVGICIARMAAIACLEKAEGTMRRM